MRRTSVTVWAAAIVAALSLSGGVAVAGNDTAGTTNENYTEYVGPHGNTQATAPQTKANTGMSGYVRMSHNYPNDPPKSFRMYNRSTGVAYPWRHDRYAGMNFYLNNDAPAGHSVMMQVRSSVWTSYTTTVKGYWRSN